MTPDRRFMSLPKDFWANVRLISERVGYTDRRTGTIKVPAINDIRTAYAGLTLTTDHLFDESGRTSATGELLLEYFTARARMLDEHVEPNLMDGTEAKALFTRLRKELRPTCPLPMNKQRGRKKAPAYLTGIVNMLIAHHANGMNCDHDPRSLTTITHGGVPLRTLARRVDGCFPSTVNPVAVWEIKEYYYTTTFGSRVADGVYETLLDGMELEELRESERIDVRHYLMIDAHYTWWTCGRSYLCRIFDMLHMGYVDEVLVGREVVDRLPILVRQWVDTVQRQSQPLPPSAD